MFSSKVGFNETMGGPCIGAAIWNITNNDPASPGADTDLQLGKTRKDLERLGKTWKDLERLGKTWKDLERLGN